MKVAIRGLVLLLAVGVITGLAYSADDKGSSANEVQPLVVRRYTFEGKPSAKFEDVGGYVRVVDPQLGVACYAIVSIDSVDKIGNCVKFDKLPDGAYFGN